MTMGVEKMALNNAWANATLYRALANLPQEDLTTRLPSFFGTILRTLNHIHQVDLYYLDALTGDGLGRKVFERDDIGDLSALGHAQAETDMALARFCYRLDASDWDRPCATERPDGTVEETTGAILLHLFQHQIHHRGQIHGMISQSGGEPPQLDEFYLRWDRAESAQPYWEET